MDIYNIDTVMQYQEDDIIDSAEEGFMLGYLSSM